ncbi:Undecaprenyl phosphate N,N'-diacetylbacillosamine 1-phosphate transferase [bioreactor metagenome]|uniref:Undecaprenyl phosphate N,N'-diacetylbacillosamine 1-phosphate transferase n=1 Tax=bioreactor metagenome TaxID=1076179 RepID=A0A644YTL6_9ZZZZ
MQKFCATKQGDKYLPEVCEGFYSKYLKRFLDIVFSFIALILLLPVLLIIALLVKINLGSPVIFKQERPGKDEKLFYLYKFRSMSDEIDENGEPLPEILRLTKFGIKLRTLSLDELPELFNILKGDMSIVGPRPLLTKYLPYYTEVERLRHAVRPGLTGLAQINGRNYCDWNNRLAYDVQYAKKITFLWDIKIIFHTVKVVLGKKDIAQDPKAVEPEFIYLREKVNI